MKTFNHYSNCNISPNIEKLRLKFKMAGKFIYFELLEMVSNKVEAKTVNNFTAGFVNDSFDLELFALRNYITLEKLLEILNYMAGEKIIDPYAWFIEKKIFIPNLLKEHESYIRKMVKTFNFQKYLEFFRKNQEYSETFRKIDLFSPPHNVMECNVIECNINPINSYSKNNDSSSTKDEVSKDNLLFPEEKQPKEDFLLTKKKKKLTGIKLQWFNKFWDEFNYKQGKREAADSWLEIKDLDTKLFDKIIYGAKCEAKKRLTINYTAKMAQGWLSSCRWEDYEEITNNKTKIKVLKKCSNSMCAVGWDGSFTYPTKCEICNRWVLDLPYNEKEKYDIEEINE